MSDRARRLLAWGLLVVAVSLLLTVVVVAAATAYDIDVRESPMVAVALSFAVVGAVVAAGAPSNSIGWLVLAIGLGLALFGATTALVELGIASPGTVPVNGALAWLASNVGLGTFVALMMLLSRLPTGAFPSPRWRAVDVLAAAALIAGLAASFAPGPFEDHPELDNPFGIPGFGFVASDVLQPVVVGMLFTVLVVSLTSIVVRFRRARGIERQQLKWVASAVGTTVILWLLAFVTSYDDSNSLMWVAWSLSLCAVPVSIGVAVRRYRLYDLDRVISRALVYGALTVILGAAYAGLVLGRAGGLLVVRGGVEPGDRGVDAGGGGVVPAGARAGAEGRRPAVLPASLRRAADARELRGAPTRPGRAADARRRSGRGRRGDDAADPRLALAPARDHTVSPRPLSVLAGSLIVITVGLTVAVGATFAAKLAPFTLLVGLWALVGALLVALRPANAVGWLFAAAGLFWLTGMIASSAAESVGPGAGLTLASWCGQWFWIAGFVSMFCSLFLVPTGHVPSQAWRPVMLTFATAGLVVVIVAALEDEVQASMRPNAPVVQNPIGIPGVGHVAEPIALFLGLLGFLAAAASLVARFRRGGPDERRGLKLIALAGVVMVVSVFLGGVFDSTLFGSVCWAIAAGVVPAACAVAILRHRLFDVDVVISKTLVYGSLSMILGAAYAGLVIATQAAFSSFAGGSNLAIALSTLAVAALFLPVRSRVQRVVDRRFYRRRYDAQRTLEAFGARLRDQVDLETLQAELRAVVSETMQPAHVSLSRSAEAGR